MLVSLWYIRTSFRNKSYLQVYIQPRKVTEDVEEAQKERIRETNRQLEELEKLSVDLNRAAPHLPAIPVPQIGSEVFYHCLKKTLSFNYILYM